MRSRAWSLTAGFVEFGHDLAPANLGGRYREHPRGRLALVLTPFRYLGYLTVGRLGGLLGRESDCVVVRNYYTSRFWNGPGATARRLTFSPHVETDRPHTGAVRL